MMGGAFTHCFHAGVYVVAMVRVSGEKRKGSGEEKTCMGVLWQTMGW